VQAAQVATWKDSPAAQLRPLHLYIAYIALIMASVSLLSFLMGRSAPSSSAISSAPATEEVTPIQGSTAQRPTNGAKKSNTGIKTPATAGFAPAESAIARRPDRLVEPGKPVQIDVKLTAQSWLEVEVDGDVKLAEVLPEGTERSWAASNRLRVRAGNAGGVLLAYNGGKAEQMGAPGAVEEKTFTLSQDSNQDSSQNLGSSSKPATAPAQR
jgi:hypothetical protein